MPVPKAMLMYAKSIRGKPEAEELAKALGFVAGSKGGTGGRSVNGPPYYYKQITGVDPSSPDGWGVVGEFVQENKLPTLRPDDTFVFKHIGSDGKNKYELFRVHSVSSSYPVHLANGTTKTIHDAHHLYSFTEWKDGHAFLVSEGVLPHVTAAKKVLRKGSP